LEAHRSERRAWAERRREKREGETGSRFHPKNEKGGINWNLRDWGGHDEKLRERHREARTPHVGANALLCRAAPLLHDPMTAAFLADLDSLVGEQANPLEYIEWHGTFWPCSVTPNLIWIGVN
jgi:hypothetical protein